MATPTMDSIKKKMQSMKLEKENAMDRADQQEQKTKELEEKLKLVSFLNIFFVCVPPDKMQYFNLLNIKSK